MTVKKELNRKLNTAKARLERFEIKVSLTKAEILDLEKAVKVVK